MIEVLHEGDIARSDRPLLTFWVQCYAHEKFVAESIRSALAQAQTPMEVLISDDASPDDTFRFAREAARAFDGPHRVTLLRSDVNRGIFGHVNEVMPHLKGRFIVWQSADDVAEPDRAAALVSAIVAARAVGAFSNHRVIDDEGREISFGLPPDVSATLDAVDYASGRFLDFTYGGTIGFAREVFDRLGPLPEEFGGRGLEHCLAFRAALLGRNVYVASPLVRRRRHAHSVTEGISAADRQSDPIAVHEKRITVRLMILAMLRSHLLGADGRLRSVEAGRPDFDSTDGRRGWMLRSIDRVRGIPARWARMGDAALSDALAAQMAVEAERLVRLRSFDVRRARDTAADAAQFDHAGLQYDPPALHFVRQLSATHNLLAFECMYHAVPRALGSIEPCRLRNHDYEGVISAFTERELLQRLALVCDETDRTRLRGFRRRVRRS